MKYSRKQYQDFLSTEIETQVRGYEQIVNTKAMVLKNRGDVFVGMFLKINEQGFAIFKVRQSDKMPRKILFGRQFVTLILCQSLGNGEIFHG